MLKLDLMPMNNGQEHWGALEWEKPMKEEKEFSDGVTHNQNDYIFALRRFKSSIYRAKSRTFPGADINSDHDVVMMTMKLKLKQNFWSHSSRLKFNLEKLKDPGVTDCF